MHLEIWQWFIVILCAFGIGLSKGGFTGVGILPIAVFALVVPPTLSVGLVLPLLICGDMVAVPLFRRHAVWAHLTRLFPWAAAGIILGFLLLYALQIQHYDRKVVDHQVGRLIGVILIVMVLLHLWRNKKLQDQPEQEATLIPPQSWMVPAVGIAAGFTTMVANAAGPIMVIYLLAMRLPKMQFIGTGAWYFLILNVFKVPFIAYLGLINLGSLSIDLLLAPFVVGGVFAGRAIIPHINQKLFEGMALTLTFLAALRMLI